MIYPTLRYRYRSFTSSSGNSRITNRYFHRSSSSSSCQQQQERRIKERILQPQLQHYTRSTTATAIRSLMTTKLFDPDRCNKNVIYSPFPPISEWRGKIALYEFITEDFIQHGGVQNGDKTAIFDGSTGMERTYHDYYHLSSNLAGVLYNDCQIQYNSTVALFCPNHVDYLPIILAVSLCGGTIIPINPLYTRNELTTILIQSQSTVLIAHTSTLDVALESIKHYQTPVQHVIVVTDDASKNSHQNTTENIYISENVPFGTISLDSIRKQKHPKAFDQTISKVRKDPSQSPVIIPYSSGTTGLPKGVCLSHYNIVSNLLQIEQIENQTIEPWSSIFTPLPFFHIYALTFSLMYSAWQGLTLVTMSKKFNLRKFCQLIQEYKPERCHLVPPILLRIANDPIVEQYDLSSIETIVSAAAPLSRDVELAVENRIGGKCRVKQAWGMSELSPIGTINADTSIRTGSIGPLISSTIGKILDSSGNSLPPNQNGELVIQGPQVMMGYLDNPTQTQECISPQGWLRTGDIAYYDNDGYFFITDRIKELIKVRGHQVAPAELEAVLLTHPDVVDAAVIGIPDDYSGELPRAYVVLRTVAIHSSNANSEQTDEEANEVNTPNNTTESQIYEWVKEHVAGYKRLDGGIIFVDAIPKSASGKILRRILRDQAKTEID